MRDQAEQLRRMVQHSNMAPKSAIIKHSDGKARVIAVTSGKGGVGKTNLTVNLALALASYSQKVLIIDADLGLSNVDVVLGCSSPYNISNLLQDDFSSIDTVAEGPRGIRYISGGSGIYQLANLSEQQLHNFVNKITLFDSWADIILIDTGAGLSRNVLNFVMAADEVVIVTTPEPTAITDAYAMVKAYATHQGRAPLNLIVNRVTETEEGNFVVDKLIRVAQRFLGLEISSLGFVFDDRNMIKAVKSQMPVLLSYPNTISARCIENIAHRLIIGEEITPSKGMRGFLQRFLHMLR